MDNNTRIPIKAEIYHIADGKNTIKAYANVAIGDYMFINSVSIAVGSFNNQLIVYPPSNKYWNKHKKKIDFKRILEFKSNCRLWEVITKVCLLAYAKYGSDKRLGVFGEPMYIKIEDLVDTTKTNGRDALEPRIDNDHKLLY